jgi:hypothetical protein
VSTLDEESVLSLQNSAMKLVPVMFKFVAEVSESDANATDDTKVPNSNTVVQQINEITPAISQLTKLIPTEFRSSLLKKLVHRLLESVQTQEVHAAKLWPLLALSHSLVASTTLDDSDVNLLYRAVKTIIRNDELGPKVQERAYKVLNSICEHHHSFMVETVRLTELIELLQQSTLASHVSARNVRLQCIAWVVNGLSASDVTQLV